MATQSVGQNDNQTLTLKLLNRARIVIVDDNEGNLALLEQVLALDGYHNAVFLKDPSAVIPALRETPADLLLLDLRMSPIDGFAVMEQVHCLDSVAAGVPVLVLTADDSYQTRQRAYDAGAQKVLIKPLDLATLRQSVRELLEIRYRNLKKPVADGPPASE